MSFAKFLRWILPSFVKRWLGYDQFERITTLPTRQLGSGDPMFWSLADFYAADWIDGLNEAEKDLP